MKTVCLALATMLVSVSAGLVRAYSVEPRSASESGWTPWLEPNNYVSEVITVNFDLPITAALFCGSSGAGGDYQVSILTYPGDIESGLDVV
jgi:hypothetical protein